MVSEKLYRITLIDIITICYQLFVVLMTNM